MKRRALVVAAVLGILAGTVACSDVSKALNQLAPEIVGQLSRSGTTGILDYTVWIDCTVRNNGADGEITIEADLRGSEGFWNKRTTVVVAAEREEKVILEFPEATLLSSGLDGYEYSCSAS